MLAEGLPAGDDPVARVVAELSADHEVVVALSGRDLPDGAFDVALATSWQSTVHLFGVTAVALCRARVGARVRGDGRVAGGAAGGFDRARPAGGLHRDRRRGARCPRGAAARRARAARAAAACCGAPPTWCSRARLCPRCSPAARRSCWRRMPGPVEHMVSGLVAEPDDPGGRRAPARAAGRRSFACASGCGRARARRSPTGLRMRRRSPRALAEILASPPPESARWPHRLMGDVMARRRAAAPGPLRCVGVHQAPGERRGLSRRAEGPRSRRGIAAAAGDRAAGEEAPAVKACFVGQREYFEQCSLLEPAGGVEPFFVDHRGGSDPSPVRVALDEIRPDVVLVFRPETLPAGFLRGVEALTLGFNTEPIPRDAAGAVHPEQAFRLSELAQTDASQFDRIITFDPMGAATAESAGIPVWRSVPLPVADHLYAASLAAARPPAAHRVRRLFDRAPRAMARRPSSTSSTCCTSSPACVSPPAWTARRRASSGARSTSASTSTSARSHPSRTASASTSPPATSSSANPSTPPTASSRASTTSRSAPRPSCATSSAPIHTDPDAFRTIRIRGHAKSATFRASSVFPRLLRGLRRGRQGFRDVARTVIRSRRRWTYRSSKCRGVFVRFVNDLDPGLSRGGIASTSPSWPGKDARQPELEDRCRRTG